MYKIFGFLASQALISQGVFYLVHVSTYTGVFFGILEFWPVGARVPVY